MKVTSYGLMRLEKFEFETMNGLVATIGHEENEEARGEVHDFNGGCMYGVFGAYEG